MLNIKQDSNIITPGMYSISNDMYHSSNGISNSGLRKFMQSPLHYWHHYVNPRREVEDKTPCLILGDAIHAYILEPERYHKEYFVHEKVDRRTKEGKTRWDEIQKLANGRTCLTQEDEDMILAIAFSLHTSEAMQLMQGALVEQSIYWEDKNTGVLCKSRPDIINLEKKIIVDIKSTENASKDAFRYAIRKYGYHVQAAMMQEAVLAQTGERIEQFVFVAFEKSAPHAVGVYMLSPESLDEGRWSFMKQLPKIKECLETNTWPSYQTDEICILNNEDML